MTVWYLVLSISTFGLGSVPTTAVIPHAMASEQQCHDAGRLAQQRRHADYFRCVEIPAQQERKP